MNHFLLSAFIAMICSEISDVRFAVNLNSQPAKTYVVIIPSYIDQGSMNIESKHTGDSSAVSFVFTFHPESPHYLVDAAFSLMVAKKGMKLDLRHPKYLTVHHLMDSLKIHGRPFFRQNLFYAILPGDVKNEYRPAKGEYIYFNYKDDDN